MAGIDQDVDNKEQAKSEYPVGFRSSWQEIERVIIAIAKSLSMYTKSYKGADNRVGDFFGARVIRAEQVIDDITHVTTIDILTNEMVEVKEIVVTGESSDRKTFVDLNNAINYIRSIHGFK